MTDQEEKGFDQEPDFGDEELWRELTRQLWLIGRGSQNLATDFEADSSTSVAAEDARKADCLPFARYHAIAKQESTLTPAEQEHFSRCRYCERHLAAFVALVPPAAKATSAKPEVVTRTTWFEWITGSKFDLRWAIPALAVIAIIIAAAFFVIKYRPANQKEIAVGPNGIPSSSPSPAATATPTAFPKTDDSALHRNNPPVNANATGRKPKPSVEQPLMIAAAEQEQINESLERGKISLEGTDFKTVLEPTRSAGNEKVSLIYPRNEVTLDTRPTFRWKGPTNLSYRIIVTYLDGSEVDSSNVLAQSNGHLKKRLDPGIYYWRLAAQRKGEPEETVSGYTIFKVVSKAEIRQTKAAVNSTTSHLVRAVLYARAGFLREAESELKAELNKTPDSPVAKSMLTQVQDWRRK